MKFFLQNLIRVRLATDELSFECSPARFHELEPEYPVLAEGRILRYWTQECSYEVDGAGARYPCMVDCGPYVDKLATYTDYPVIYAHVSLSKTTLCINSDPVDSITFECHIKPSMDPEDDDLPVTQDWIIRLTHEDGLKFDGFHANFVNGACSKIYTYKDGLPLGDWYADESLFNLVEVGEQVYKIVLAQPVRYTLYREFL